MSSLEELLLQFFASVADREKGAAYIEGHPDHFQELLALACSPAKNREHIVAAWVLEKYALARLDCLDKCLETFLQGTLVQTHESKRRPMIKLTYHYCRNKKRREALSSEVKDTLVEICFSYLLEAEKIASIAFALKTLDYFLDHAPWIRKETIAYIERESPKRGRSFQAVVRHMHL